MKKKKLVIFFLALVSIYFIYEFTYEKKFTYLAIGDDLAKGHTPFNTYGKSYTDYLYNYLKSEEENIKINKKYIKEDIRIIDLINEIEKNDKPENISQAIKEANLITISIGSEELFNKIRSLYNNSINNKILYKYVDELANNLEHLISDIKEITNAPIYLIGYYSPINSEDSKLNSLFNYIDIKMKTIEKLKKINYVNIYEGFKEKSYYLPNKNHAFPSLEGYNYIANQIIAKIKES